MSQEFEEHNRALADKKGEQGQNKFPLPPKSKSQVLFGDEFNQLVFASDIRRFIQIA